MKTLYKEYQFGKFKLKNRIVMPPMTRARALGKDVANPISAEYYAQRASAGLIISEGTQISQQGKGYAWTPGIYTDEQIKGWRLITNKVHSNNGVIFAQLWHVGRISHTSLQVNNQPPVAPSSISAKGVKIFIDPDNKGQLLGVGDMVQHTHPRALTVVEIEEIIKDFGKAALNAMQAGFDGVEIHAANGYLINQFLDSQTNIREDEYGGSLQNRLRFLKEVTQEVVSIIGKENVGVRLAPLTTLQGAVDDNPEETYTAAAKDLNDLDVAYLHIAEADWDDAPLMPIKFKKVLRDSFSGSLIYSGKYNKGKAEAAIKEGWADMIGFGRLFIANPDLPFRLENDLPFNPIDEGSFFGGGEKGLTDYPFYKKTKNDELQKTN